MTSVWGQVRIPKWGLTQWSAPFQLLIHTNRRKISFRNFSKIKKTTKNKKTLNFLHMFVVFISAHVPQIWSTIFCHRCIYLYWHHIPIVEGRSHEWDGLLHIAWPSWAKNWWDIADQRQQPTRQIWQPQTKRIAWWSGEQECGLESS